MAKRKRRKRYSGPDLTGHLTLDEGDRFEVEITGINDGGIATAEIDGAPIEVAGAIVGESVVAEVLRKYPERVAAKTVDVLEASPDRVEPACKYFLECTGCQWQHVSYARQLDLKRDRVVKELSAFDSLSETTVLQTVESPRQLGYRNHGRFTVAKKQDAGSIGYVNATTRQWLKIDECLLMDSQINEALNTFQERLAGQSQLSIRVGSNSGSMLVQPKMEVQGIDIETGVQHYEEEVRERRFTIAASSFFQVNTDQLSQAVDEIRELLELTGDELLVDAYCGVGVFAVLLAPYARKVVGIEESASAIEDAGRNSEGVDNVEFVEGKTEHVLKTWNDQYSEQVDAVILDPPRVGCHPDVIESVKVLNPRKLLMVSCDPSALARDLDLLCADGSFELEFVKPVDMFPQTKHVETISLLRSSK